MPVRNELSLFLSSGILIRVQAQQGIVFKDISNLTSKWCFGQTLTLLCTHPDPFEDPDKYTPQAIGFIENGKLLDFGEPATGRRFTLTRLNSTASALSFTMTVDYHANEIYCSCFLSLNGGGGGREESDPLHMNTTTRPPTITSKPDSTPGLLEWNSSPSCGTYNYTYNFTLTWDRIGGGSTGTVSIEENRFNFTGMPKGDYTASLTTRVTSFSNLSESVPTHVQFSLTDSPQNTPAAAAGGTVSLTALAAVSAVAGLFLIISMVLAVILVGVLVRMRRRRREEGQERKRRVQAQQGIVLTSSGELCFGQTVTLTCTHPDPLQDLVKYRAELIAWAENGVRLDFTLPATGERFIPTRLNSTASTLSFNVTEEDHANRVITCSCFLTLTGGSGGRDESDPPITIDVEETIQPPTLVSTPNSTPGLLQWNSPSSSCSNYNYSFTLNWTRIGDGSTGTVSTAENRYTFTINGSYTVNITAAIVDFNLKESEPLSVDFTTSVTVSPQNVPATAAEGIVCLTVLAAVSAVAGLFMIIIIVLAVILVTFVGVLVRMRRRRREEGQERKRRDPGEANVPPVPMTTNPSYAQVQHSTEKKIPLYGNL